MGMDAAPEVVAVASLSAEHRQLVAAARRARERAWAPYSNFAVGAAVLDADGSVHLGCNVETPSFGLTLCAERVALFAARAAGATRPVAIAVVASTRDGRPVPPCGACRQVIADLAGDVPVLSADADGDGARCWTAAALLPEAFTRHDLPGFES